MKRRTQAAVVIVAVAAGVAPVPSAWVETAYSSRVFPWLQHGLTALSNLFPFALFDWLCIAAIAAFAVVAWRARARGWRGGLLHVARVLVVGAAIVYLVFLATWGLNYRRVAMMDKVVFDPSRITRRAAGELGEQNVAALNRYYGDAHRAAVSIESLARGFQDAQRRLGAGRVILPARPKDTLLGGYFHAVSVSGMTDPFLLETLLAPDILEVEKPFVISHEWAHLAGYADESEANFVAWLACRHGDALAQYSSALITLGHAAPERPLRDILDIGPRIDLDAMRQRYREGNVVLRQAAQRGYDTYLKANRVEKGIESYDAVLQLILGTEFRADGYPRLR
jgi:hypothetical protein